MPDIHPELSKDQKDKLYENLIWDKWAIEKNNIPKEQWDVYESEISKEISIVKNTNHSEYFLLDYEIVKRGIEKGGIITYTGRGSGPSFITNKLLGFTDVDRISAKVKMYPERFMSETRILESKSLVDLDLNLGNPKVFAEAQEEVIGKNHSYPMIAYGTMKPKSAWKMYAKSQDVDFDTSNKISGQIERWIQAVGNAEEDDKEDISILDYIDKKYHSIYEQSILYQGIIDSFSIHPCAYLIYQGDIRREIGLIKLKENLCCVMDGKWAEEYKFLKNDLLKVSVVETISKIYDRINIPQHSIRELLDILTPDNKAWDVYKKGIVLGINQVEQPNTTHKAMKYVPKNISEMCAFVAAIRPGCAAAERFRRG